MKTFTEIDNWVNDLIEAAMKTRETEQEITAAQAREFWRDLMGTLGYDPDSKATRGIMSEHLIAEYMGITPEKAEAFLRRCSREDLHLTERQGGGWVV